jgi:hypothetical protein
MDLSAIIVASVLGALFFGTAVGLGIYSRKTQQKEAPADKAGNGVERSMSR